MMKLLESWGSPLIKKLQIVAIIVGMALAFLYSIKCFGHVDLHFHSLEWEIQQHKTQQEVQEKKSIERSLKENDPNISKEDLKREVQKEKQRRESS